MAVDIPTSLTDPLFEGINRILPKLPTALIELIFGLLLIRVLSWIAQALLALVRLPKGLRGILHSMIDGLLVVFLSIVFLQSLGLGNIALVFSGSIAALGIAFGIGAQTLSSDILAGIFLARDRDFSVGDEVIAGEKPTQGVIESMDMRRIRIRAKDGKLHVIPNSVIERKEWVMVEKKGRR